MIKKIVIAKRKEKINEEDAWVNDRRSLENFATQVTDPEDSKSINSENEKKVAKRRLTLDISDDFHRLIKASCARKGVTMSEEVERLLTKHFKDTEKT